MTAAETRSLLDTAIHRAAVIPLPGRTHLEITGADRAAFLHNFCTNHIKGLSVGQGCEAFVTNIKGRILGHVLVYADSERLLLETVPGQATALLSHLDRYIITEDVQLADRSTEWTQLFISGSESEGVLKSTLGIPEFAPGAGVRIVPVGEGSVRRFSLGAVPGYSIVGPVDWVSSCQEKLVAAGAGIGGPDLFEQLRVEAGFPIYSIDLSEDNLAQEANRTSRAISFNKGCYLGQEPIARLDSMGHVNRALCQVISNSPAAVPAGADVFAAVDAAEPAGKLTSATVWPLTGQTVGLGLLRRELAREGWDCWIGNERIPATVRVK